MLGNLDLTNEAIEIGSAAVVGGLQRFAWEKSMPIGFLATTGSIIGGIMLEQSGSGTMKTFGTAAKFAGSALLGWVVTEKFITKHGSDHVMKAARAQGALSAGGARDVSGARATQQQRVTF